MSTCFRGHFKDMSNLSSTFIAENAFTNNSSKTELDSHEEEVAAKEKFLIFLHKNIMINNDTAGSFWLH